MPGTRFGCKTDELNDYLDFIEKYVNYKMWFFGHFHGDEALDEKHVMLYERVLQIL